VSICMVTLRNWDKFNPRKDRANHSWLRLQNNFFQDPEIFELTQRQSLLYLYCMCEASKRGDQTIKLSPNLASAILKTTPEKLINDLKALGDLVSVSRRDDGKVPAKSLTTNERTNVTNGTNEHVLSTDADLILSHWHSKKIRKHKITDSIAQQITLALALRAKSKPPEYQLVEWVNEAINNYADILGDPASFWTYKWPLWIFLSRSGALEFYPQHFHRENYYGKRGGQHQVSQVKSLIESNPFVEENPDG